MPRVPHYQTTPFTIDPSARSTQTFAERYGVSPPQSNENLYGNDYTIIGSHDDKSTVRKDRQTGNHKVELSNAPSSSNIVQTGKNINSSTEGERLSKASKSTVIKGSKNIPNNTHSISSDVEQRLQVSSASRHFFPTFFSNRNRLLIMLCHIHHIIYVRNNFSNRSCETKRVFVFRMWKFCVDWNVTGGSFKRELFCIQSFIFRLTKHVLRCFRRRFSFIKWIPKAPHTDVYSSVLRIIRNACNFAFKLRRENWKLQLQSRSIVSFLLNLTSDDIETWFYAENVFSPSACDVSSDEHKKQSCGVGLTPVFNVNAAANFFPLVCYAFYL